MPDSIVGPDDPVVNEANSTLWSLQTSGIKKKKKKKVVNIEYNVQSRQTPQESHSSVWQLWLCVLFAYSEDPSEMIL